MGKDVIELCTLNINVYRCISEGISTDRVVLTDKQIIHMENSHPEAYKDVISELKNTIEEPDYIICDGKHKDTGLVVRRVLSTVEKEHIFIVLRICTDTYNGEFANSIISGWKISEKRLQSYLRNKKILYTKEQN